VPDPTKKDHHFQLRPYIGWTAFLLAAALLVWMLLTSWAKLIPR
jgi:hypothetical protein